MFEDGEKFLEMSKEMYQILETVYNSEFYTSDPAEACIFLPSVDLLNTRKTDNKLVSVILSELAYWGASGKNHLILNIINNGQSLPTGEAILATPDHLQLRLGYDLTIPALSPLNISAPPPSHKRPHLLSYPQHSPRQLTKTLAKHSEDLTLPVSLDPLSRYVKLLTKATFCLVPLPSVPVTLLTDCLAAGSIPVLVTASPPALPLSQLIDWTEVSVRIRPESLPALVSLLQSFTTEAVRKMQSAGMEAYTRHMASPADMIRSVLSILEKTQGVSQLSQQHQVSYPTLSPPNTGFTAVILTYNRVASLYQVIQRVSMAESLARIVVVWNHQSIAPPPAEDWPRISKPLKVIQTSGNRLSNRFHPYAEIETECVLSMDDDINMMTTDELEFAYQVWREFPDRVVGFPSRTHVHDNSSGHYKYESEWVNDISMVLTGVAFYHKYWHYLYTAATSPEQRQIKDWVDEHINCEDIAFNMMVANATGKSVIKVGPRKKFKCSTPTCENSGMLSASPAHLSERSSCLDKFVKIYGHNPLQSVQFRADPVLYKDKLPSIIKMYKDIGSL